jgi:hypothetical protein
MKTTLACLAAAAAIIVMPALAHAEGDAKGETAANPQTAAAPADRAREQELHQRVFGSTPDMNCIDGSCVQAPIVPRASDGGAQAPDTPTQPGGHRGHGRR